MGTEKQLEKGKLYQVTKLHPNRVSEPLDLCFYPSTILKNGSRVRDLLRFDGTWQEHFLKEGDIFMFLGNTKGSETWSYMHEYLTILLGDKILSSNCCFKTTLDYYEVKQVGDGA